MTVLSVQAGILPVKKALALNHLQQILVLTILAFSLHLKFGYLPQSREIS